MAEQESTWLYDLCWSDSIKQEYQKLAHSFSYLSWAISFAQKTLLNISSSCPINVFMSLPRAMKHEFSKGMGVGTARGTDQWDHNRKRSCLLLEIIAFSVTLGLGKSLNNLQLMLFSHDDFIRNNIDKILWPAWLPTFHTTLIYICYQRLSVCECVHGFTCVWRPETNSFLHPFSTLLFEAGSLNWSQSWLIHLQWLISKSQGFLSFLPPKCLVIDIYCST